MMHAIISRCLRMVLVGGAVQLCLLTNGHVHGAGPASQPATDQQIHLKKPSFKAPDVDPNKRMNGSARGPADPVKLFVLAPQSTGFTASPTPVLYWFISSSTKEHVEVDLAEPGVEEPLLKTIVVGAEAGLHAVKLSEAAGHPTLQPGKMYKFTVELKPRPSTIESQQCGNPYSIGTISNDDKQSTLWYDAITELCRQIDEHPADADLKKQLESKLRDEKVFQILSTSSVNGTLVPDDQGNKLLEADMFKILEMKHSISHD